MQVWINNDNPKNVAQISQYLESAVKRHAGKELKAFVVFINPQEKAEDVISKDLQQIGTQAKLNQVSLSFLPGPKDHGVEDYEINMDPKVKNTVLVYKDKKLDTKFVNFVPDKKGVKALEAAIQKVVK